MSTCVPHSNNDGRESSANSRRESRGSAMRRWSSSGERRRGGMLRESRYICTHKRTSTIIHD